MLLGRKKKLSLKEKISNFLFPKKGYLRAYKYHFQRLLHLKGSKNSIARGAVVGVTIAVTPFFGLQLILTFLLDFILKANITASLITTCIGNVATFPFIWFLDYKIGNLILKENNIDNASFMVAIENIKNAFTNHNWKVIEENAISILLPMTIGSFILAFILGIITYFTVIRFLTIHQNKGIKK